MCAWENTSCLFGPPLPPGATPAQTAMAAAATPNLECDEKLDDEISPTDVSVTPTQPRARPRASSRDDVWSDLTPAWVALCARWRDTPAMACVRGPACSWCLSSLMNDCESATQNQAEMGYSPAPVTAADARLFLRRRTLALHDKLRSSNGVQHIFNVSVNAVVVAHAKLLLARCVPGTFTRMAGDALADVRARTRAGGKQQLLPCTFAFAAHANTLADLSPAECALIVFYATLGLALVLSGDAQLSLRWNLLAAALESDPRIVEAMDFAELRLMAKGLNFEFSIPEQQLCAATEKLLRSHADD